MRVCRSHDTGWVGNCESRAVAYARCRNTILDTIRLAGTAFDPCEYCRQAAGTIPRDNRLGAVVAYTHASMQEQHQAIVEWAC
jgi:hypothetical protein